MTNYWDKRFLDKINHEPKIIFEVGARYGDESIYLSQLFKNSQIYSFECNPNTIEICKNKLEKYKNINFIGKGLGDKNTNLPFYSYIKNNDGASSFYKRIDGDTTQEITGYIEITKISDIMNHYNLENIDLLCMDVQGFELNVLKGAEKYLEKVNYIIMEEPNPIINLKELPKNTYSKYINSPTPNEIKEFMIKNNFSEIVRIPENEIEHNVMYKNKKLDVNLIKKKHNPLRKISMYFN
jgi:FkbM family methyltransferase